MQNQLLAELQRQGHETLVLDMPKDIPAKEVLRKVLKEAVEFRPDALLVLNNMGLDHYGTIIGVLARLPLPVILWYLDNYRFCGPLFIDDIPETVVVFSSDKALLPVLEQAGFPHRFYLPLATDISLGSARNDKRFSFLHDKVSYVGGTFSKMVDHFHSKGFEAIYNEWQPDLTAAKQATGVVNLDEVFQSYRERLPSLQTFYNFIAYIV